MAGDDDLWGTQADWLVSGFTGGVDPEYQEQILPLAAERLAGAGRVLDIGAGEGQVARLAASLDIEVVGVDPTWNQITIAGTCAGAPGYLRPSAPHLPAPCDSFDADDACLVFERIEEVQKDVHVPSTHRPLNYLNALIPNGLLLIRIGAAAPPPGFPVRAAECGDVTEISPLLLLSTETLR